jgi:hypothetical protein
MDLATFWAIFSQTNLVTLLPGNFLFAKKLLRRRFDEQAMQKNIQSIDCIPISRAAKTTDRCGRWKKNWTDF